jgi:hypothetical protein
MANNQLEQPERPRPWLARFISAFISGCSGDPMVLGFVAGTCIGAIINDVAGIHGATLYGASIGIGLGLLLVIWVRPPRKQ